MPKINAESFSLSQTLRSHLIHDHLPMQSNIQKRRQRTRYLTRLTTSRRKNSLRWKKWSQAVKNQQKVAQTRFGTILNWFPTNRRTTATSSISASIVFTFFITCCEYLIRLCCKFNLYILCVQRNNVSQPNHIQLLFRLNFKLHIYFAVQVDNISY